MANFKAFVKDGVQYLASPDGTQIPRLIYTKIEQNLKEPGVCEFTAYVNSGHGVLLEGNNNLVYHEKTKLLMLNYREHLPVTILEYHPGSKDTPSKIRATCLVDFVNTSNKK